MSKQLNIRDVMLLARKCIESWIVNVGGTPEEHLAYKNLSRILQLDTISEVVESPKRWRYLSENLRGNLHAAAAYITEHHPEWDVVALESTGHYTVVMYREPYHWRVVEHEVNPANYHEKLKAHGRTCCDICPWALTEEEQS